MSRLYSSGFSGPIDAIIFAESGWTGRPEMSRFHQLSGGKTCRAARIVSASGVSNITGFVIFGIGGRAPSAASGERRPRSPRGAGASARCPSLG